MQTNRAHSDFLVRPASRNCLEPPPMASKGDNTGLNRVMALVVVLAALCARATAQSGCTSVLMSLAPCLSFVTGSSSTPSSSCCSQLASVVQSQPRCLCMVLNGGASSLGVTLNQTLALALPGACNVQTPPISKCNAASGGMVAPAGSPDSSPSDISGGSKDVPSPAGSFTSHGIAKMPPLPLAVLSVLMATFGYVPAMAI
ncbi:non-specific lipid transfer protein GPI-anchored 19 isoform X1 [Eucalyptus grandis]|uniref:non-specific lipid transfer protein GPI-anchored 19 isoform X1 n=1 Tax=Eucalyptus grandis TaxID=71139 RepID=UPI00192EEAB0|nr:non-specific lipid transfer protein GPI-anchored 19 isoform X1 [Eucalyptus grandis]